jgi:hypothetical protein
VRPFPADVFIYSVTIAILSGKQMLPLHKMKILIERSDKEMP